MFSVVQVFYKDLWLPEARRRVKQSGHSSASWSSKEAQVGKKGLGSLKHFQAKEKTRVADPTKGTTADASDRTHLSSLTPPGEPRKGHWSKLNHYTLNTLPHTMVKHPAPCSWRWLCVRWNPAASPEGVILFCI